MKSFKNLMEARVSVANVRKLVESALKQSQSSVKSLESGKDNPSVIDLYYRAEGRVDALENVLKALQGSDFSLKQMGK